MVAEEEGGDGGAPWKADCARKAARKLDRNGRFGLVGMAAVVNGAMSEEGEVV